MRHLLLATTCIVAVTAMGANAQSPYLASQNSAYQRNTQDNFPYWYLGLNAQLAYVHDSDVSSPATGVTEIEHDTGYNLGASLGFRPYARSGLLRDMRFEIEYAYRDLEQASMTQSGAHTGLDSDLITHSVMLNAFYDFNNSTQWTPYIGAGLGVAFVDMTSPTLNVDDSDETFAYQGMIGLAYAPEMLPDTEWGLGYRYVGMTDPELTTAAGDSVEFDYNSHNFEIFSRFRF